MRNFSYPESAEHRSLHQIKAQRYTRSHVQAALYTGAQSYVQKYICTYEKCMRNVFAAVVTCRPQKIQATYGSQVGLVIKIGIINNQLNDCLVK